MGIPEGIVDSCREKEAIPPLCPSAPPNTVNGVVFGVVGGTAELPRVGYLAKSVPITEEVLGSTAPVPPTEVLRSAVSCAERGCRHFDGRECTLITRIVESLPRVVKHLPACSIRNNCRWWRQEGVDACLRCPQIVTEGPSSSLLQQVAVPPSQNTST
jgi:hypothetical protein